jgi:hypothetical protein
LNFVARSAGESKNCFNAKKQTRCFVPARPEVYTRGAQGDETACENISETLETGLGIALKSYIGDQRVIPRQDSNAIVDKRSEQITFAPRVKDLNS